MMIIIIIIIFTLQETWVRQGRASLHTQARMFADLDAQSVEVNRSATIIIFWLYFNYFFHHNYFLALIQFCFLP